MKIAAVVLTVLVSLSIMFITGCSDSGSVVSEKGAVEEKAADGRCIGIYDSRCIAIAYYNSKMHTDYVKQIADRHKAAKDAGDDAMAKGLEEQMVKLQEQAHFQGFGTAPVVHLLDKVSDEVDKIKADNGLDMIISKWNYDADTEKCVDITDELVKLFNPNEKTLNWIKQAKDIKPISQKELEKMEHKND